MKIESLAITGNVLVVVGSRRVVAWLLTEDGTVGGVLDKRRAGPSDSIWAVPSSWRDSAPKYLGVCGQVGIIQWTKILHDAPHFAYHTGTGGVLKGPLRRHTEGKHYHLNPLRSLDSHSHRFRLDNPRIPPPGVNWRLRGRRNIEVWIIDSERRYRFWVPVRWREVLRNEDWHHDITTLFWGLGKPDGPVMIKF